MRFTHAKTRTEAINRALAEWVRRKKIEKLKSLRGSLDVAGELDDLRRLEIDEVRGLTV